jgi:hypothetical protein
MSQEKSMKYYADKWAVGLALATGVALCTLGIQAQQKASGGGVQVHLVVTVEPLQSGDDNIAVLTKEDVKVEQRRNKLPVTQWIPSRGEQAGLQLFILVDDTSDTSLGLHFDDLYTFINAQPATTWIGVGYMRNTGVNIVQNFTTDHAAAAKALRLPLGTVGASDSPYLSLISLLKGWPENKLRREVLMVTDGIDRLRGNPNGSGVVPEGRSNPGRGRTPSMSNMSSMSNMPYISPDVDSASTAAQRYGVIIHSIYTPGVGHVGRNSFVATNGQNGIAKLADETGGESFFLGVQSPVAFKPYLDRLQRILDNQYYLVFEAKPDKRPGLQRVKLSTDVPKIEMGSADSVWVPVS